MIVRIGNNTIMGQSVIKMFLPPLGAAQLLHEPAGIFFIRLAVLSADNERVAEDGSTGHHLAVGNGKTVLQPP